MRTFILTCFGLAAGVAAGCTSASAIVPQVDSGGPGDDSAASSSSGSGSDDGSSEGSTSEGGDGGYSLLVCPSGQGYLPACSSCIQTMCAAALATANSACASYFQCFCPLPFDASACGNPMGPCATALSGLTGSCTACMSICNGDAGGDGSSPEGSADASADHVGD